MVEVDPSRVPRHVAIIMDGNGRWANQRGLRRNAGHEAGEEALFRTVEGALSLGVQDLTVYAFSTENWRRSPDEVRFLLEFNRSLLLRRVDELIDRDVRVRFIGRRGRPVPRRLVDLIERTEERTAHCRRMTLRIAFNYGSRAELVDAAARVAEDVAAGRLRRVTERSLAARLDDPAMPDVDLMIRTSGEQRISNYLLWQAAYAELVFTEVLWPDFDEDELARCVVRYQARDRRYGGAEDRPAVADDATGDPGVSAARVLAVCIGAARERAFGDRTETTAIAKQPVDGPVAVGPEGLAGDVQVDRRFHGGVDRAVYAYAEEDADHWVGVLRRDVPPGLFGENLRTRGLDVSGARVGAVWRTTGGVELEVSGPRLPCRTLAGFLDVADMIQRFISAGRPGAYLRVRTPGTIAAGERLRVVTPGDGPSVGEVMAWRRGRVATDQLRRLVATEALVPDLRAWAEETLADR